MERLSARDTRAVLGCLRELHGSPDPEAFAVRASRALLGVVRADRCSFSEWRPGGVRTFIQPEGAMLGGSLGEALVRHWHQNPILTYYRRTGRLAVCTFSDFLTRAELHRLPLYNEYYRQVRVERQILAPLQVTPAPRTEVGFALSRTGSDFSARDRRVLEVLQPHLIQAHANTEAMARLNGRLAWLEGLVESRDRAAILLDRGDAIRFASARGRQFLRDYFGGPDRPRLPDALAGWVREQERPLDAERPPRRPLVVARERGSLTVRLVVDGARRALLLEERTGELDPAALETLGLTRREAEVLAWAAEGKTNEAIGVILGARTSTVAKHLERVYRKLGVESRTAAVVQALATAGLSTRCHPASA